MKINTHSHDLTLPAWGPYSKQFMGISHVPNPESGRRFDFTVAAGFYRRKLLIPNGTFESGFHLWEASPDLNYYQYRFEMVWKDQVYADISFSALDEHTRLVRCELVNHTKLPQDLVLHFLANIEYPTVAPYRHELLQPVSVILPASANWIEALDYENLRFAVPRPQDNQMPDGLFRGEIRESGLVNGTGVGQGWGRNAGDSLRYTVQLSRDYHNAVLGIRCRTTAPTQLEVPVSGKRSRSLQIPGHADWQLLSLPLDKLPAGEFSFQIISAGDSAVDFDGFILCEAADFPKIRFEKIAFQPKPVREAGPVHDSLCLTYPDIPETQYGLRWFFPDSQIRQIRTDNLDTYFRHRVYDHVSSILTDEGHGIPFRHYTNVFLRPIEIQAGETRRLYAILCNGTKDEVMDRLRSFQFDPARAESLFRKSRQQKVHLAGNANSKAFEFSQERMAATVLTNVVYPVNIKRNYVRHNSPGRWWDSLYSWDSGFIGIGLAELDLRRAAESLNTYLTDPDDPNAAFIHHGSVVPVQFYLFLELLNRGLDQETSMSFYLRLKAYYEFFVGRRGSSTTNSLQSNLLKTWDYFYNSGGWDDYPPQVFVHSGREPRVSTITTTPVVTTAHAVRIAKIMKMAALLLGHDTDVPIFENDITTFSTAIQTHCWDADEGVFSYVIHDSNGQPVEQLHHESGQNFNRGLDGLSPLIAGICTAEQQSRLFDMLQDPKRCWTPYGLSTVDGSAAYYRSDGYWNGAIWMPHQWFIWKTCLDLGEPEFAWQIAKTALRVWKREVEATYNCYEHFLVSSGRGAGWHQFGALSTPVLSWYGAYFRPGWLTTGFEVLVKQYHPDPRGNELEAELVTFGHAEKPLWVIASMNSFGTYQATWNGEKCEMRLIQAGVFNVAVPSQAKGIFRVKKIK